MTVLGSADGKADDKEQLVGKVDVSILPDRKRQAHTRRRRSIITLMLAIGCLLIFIGGTFLTVCFIKKIGPFRRHILQYCQVGSRRFNGHHDVFESYEVTDKYVLMHIPMLNNKYGTFESARILRVLDKNVTVLQHSGVCYVKPTMKYQMLRQDWFDRLGMLSLHHYRMPDRFDHCHLRVVQPRLSVDYLKEEVHQMAAAMCKSYPVFRLEFRHASNPIPISRLCKNNCSNCALASRSYKPMIVNGRRCMECDCERSRIMINGAQRWRPLNQVEGNCKRIQCKKICHMESRIRCFLCRCVDSEQGGEINVPVPRKINTIKLESFIVHAKGNGASDSTDSSIYQEKPRNQLDYGTRGKRSLRYCKVLATIFEGYTPVDRDMRVPLDYIHDC